MLAKLGDGRTSWLGDITMQYVDYPLNTLRNGPFRLKAVRVRKMGDDNIPLVFAGQVSLLQAGLEYPLGPVDLFDETEAWSWDGDILVEQSSIMRLRWSTGDANLALPSPEIGVVFE